MDRKLTAKEYLLLASMLFGLFFGAGNLMFCALIAPHNTVRTSIVIIVFINLQH